MCYRHWMHSIKKGLPPNQSGRNEFFVKNFKKFFKKECLWIVLAVEMGSCAFCLSS
jgi:hypothetical protein